MELDNLFEKTYNNDESLLFGLEPNTKIYRIMKIEHFYKMLLSKQLLFKKPILWDDPYENFISKEQLGFITDSSTPFYAELNMVYAQCWTYNKECDGMWRNYASIDAGVKIETTVQKLYDSISKNNTNFYIGKVVYKSKNNILEFMENSEFINWLTSNNQQILAEIFCIKREEFSYENEVRAMILDFNSKEDILQVDFNPLELIDKIEFAPKISKASFLENQCRLQSCYKINKEIVFKSDLYNPFGE
jgi:hypothetical protein